MAMRLITHRPSSSTSPSTTCSQSYMLRDRMPPTRVSTPLNTGIDSNTTRRLQSTLLTLPRSLLSIKARITRTDRRLKYIALLSLAGRHLHPVLTRNRTIVAQVPRNRSLVSLLSMALAGHDSPRTEGRWAHPIPIVAPKSIFVSST